MRLLLGLSAALGVTLAAAFAAALPSAAQDYPNRSVKIIVPFGAGGPADVFARIIGHHLQETLKQSFVIENRPGAGAVIGTNEVGKSAPDGYTLLMMSNTHTVNETLIPKKPFDLMRDLAPITGVSYSDLMMVVASAFSLPPLVCATMVLMASNIMSTWLPSTAVRAWSLPLCGTCTMFTPAMYLNSSPAMWYGVPGPEEA